MTESLFRKEVLEAKRTSWLGPISLAQPLPAWGHYRWRGAWWAWGCSSWSPPGRVGRRQLVSLSG